MSARIAPGYPFAKSWPPNPSFVRVSVGYPSKIGGYPDSRRHLFAEEMKQIVTIFRAEGQQALRVADLFRNTNKSILFTLRDVFRSESQSTNRFTGYIEYLDPWSMGDSFDRAMGPNSIERSPGSGSVYFANVTEEWIEFAKKQNRKRHQFAEDQRLHQFVKDLITTPFLKESAIGIILFREIVGSSVTNYEFQDGSEQCGPSKSYTSDTRG